MTPFRWPDEIVEAIEELLGKAYWEGRSGDFPTERTRDAILDAIAPHVVPKSEYLALSEYVKEAAGDESVLVPVSTLAMFNESEVHKLRLRVGELEQQLADSIPKSELREERRLSRFPTPVHQHRFVTEWEPVPDA